MIPRPEIEYSMASLDDELQERIKHLCADGDAATDAGAFDSAIDSYGTAWNLLPPPKTQWEAAAWILGSMGEAHFLAKDFERGRQALLQAMRCPGARENPFLHLRLGQCQFELGFHIVAGDALAEAWRGGGREIFRDEDPKYYDHLQEILREPAVGPE
jgi:hypothetical protein